MVWNKGGYQKFTPYQKIVMSDREKAEEKRRKEAEKLQKETKQKETEEKAKDEESPE